MLGLVEIESSLFRSVPDPVALLRSLLRDLEVQEENLLSLLRKARRDMADVRLRLSTALEELT